MERDLLPGGVAFKYVSIGSLSFSFGLLPGREKLPSLRELVMVKPSLSFSSLTLWALNLSKGSWAKWFLVEVKLVIFFVLTADPAAWKEKLPMELSSSKRAGEDESPRARLLLGMLVDVVWNAAVPGFWGALVVGMVEVVGSEAVMSRLKPAPAPMARGRVPLGDAVGLGTITVGLP